MRRRIVLGTSCIVLLGCSEPAGPAKPGVFSSVSAGSRYTCALVNSGEAYCWGLNLQAQLGTGRTNFHDSLPVPVETSLRFASVRTGAVHTCGVTAEGTAYCWGVGGSGRLGSDISSAATPVAVTGGLSFNAITLGGQHTCALTVDGTAYCWGDNRAGQLGHATPDSSVSAPVPVDGGHTFAAITAGGYFSCALALDGTAYCWGGNVVGSVGSGDTALTITAPTLVAGNHRFTAIASGSGTTCAIETSGQAYCWGYGQYGELGSGEIVRRQDTPVRVSGNRVYTAISVGGGHACALTVDSELFCWGSSGSGQLAARTSDRCPVPDSDTVYETPCTTVPVAAARGHQFQAVSAGQGHTCGLDFTAAIYCWGSNGQGELGNGHMIDATSPTRVTDPVPPPD